MVIHKIDEQVQLSADIKTSSLPGLKWIKIGSAPEFYQEKILPLLPKFGICSISHFGTADKLHDILEEDKVDLIISVTFGIPISG